MANILTIRQVISGITNSLKALNIDQHFSNRFLFNELCKYTALFIKQENNYRRIYKSSDVWTTIPCFPMEKKNPIDCCLAEVPECYFIMKSKYKLPATYTGNYGNIIREVSSILPINKPFDGIQPVQSPMFFTPVSGAKEYRNKINREFVNPNIRYYWIEDDYIYIPDTEIEGIRVVAYFVRPWETELIDYCTGEKQCIQPLDTPFNCATYLYSTIEQELLKNLMNTYERIVQDNSPDGSDSIRGPQQLTS